MKHTTMAWRLLRYSYAAVVFLAGADKILGTNLIVFWPKYVSPLFAQYLPMSVEAFLFTVGVVEVLVAILAITRLTVLASYLSAAWLVLISINLLTIGGYLDIVIRDLLLAVGAIAAAQLGMTHGYTVSGKARTV